MSTTAEVTVAALSIALGTALQISGLGGPLARTVAWSAVVMLAAFLVFQHATKRGKAAISVTDLAHRSWQLGHDLVNFRRSRKASAPRRARRWWAALTNSKREYEADTMSLFRERFGEALQEVVDELRGTGLVGVSEALTLKAPKSPGAIERVGKRLIQLGSQMRIP